MSNPVISREWTLTITYADGEAVLLGGFASSEKAEEYAEMVMSDDNRIEEVFVLPLFNFKEVEKAAQLNEIDEALDQLEDDGLVAWTGVNENGEPTFTITEEGAAYARETFGEEE